LPISKEVLVLPSMLLTMIGDIQRVVNLRNELTVGAILSMDVEHHGTMNKVFFNIPEFYDGKGFSSPANWNFHDV
jgi:hypothetical protein